MGLNKVSYMSIYKKGNNKKQQLLFPQSIDEYVSEDNQVTLINPYQIRQQAKLLYN